MIVCMHCDQLATYKDKNRRFCDMHYRFNQMRQDAAKRNKYKPTIKELFDLVPENMICPECKKQMIWRRKLNQKGVFNQITLQHWRDSSISLICISCNTRHNSMPDDSYREMPKDHKLCPLCKQIKHESNFGLKNSRSFLKRNSYCKPCNVTKTKIWSDDNREKINAWRKDYYMKRKLSGNPIPRTRGQK